MLNDYKRAYENRADSILGTDWRKEDKNVLFKKALEYRDKDKQLYDGYLSAILVRYWYSIDKNCVISAGAYTEYDAYVWLVDAALWTIEYRPWTKPELKVFNDKTGPDKCMNACLKSARAGFYQWSNAKKRKDSYTKLTSLEGMMEICGDAGAPLVDAFESFDVSTDIKNIIREEFNQDNYLHALVIDGICNSDCMDSEIDKDGKRMVWFNKKKLQKHVRNLDDNYCKIFAKTYEVDLDTVLQAKDECAKLSSDRVYTILRSCINKLRSNPLFNN